MADRTPNSVKGWTPVPVDRLLKVPSYCVITTEGHVI